MNGTWRGAAGLAPEMGVLRSLLSRQRLMRLAGFSAAQLLVQGLGVVAGLLLVRMMVPTDYGHYTTLLALVGLGAVLLDLGLANAMLALGGAHHGQRHALDLLRAQARQVQCRLAVSLGLPLALGAWLLLHQQGLSLARGAALVALCLALGLINARNAVAVAVLRLRGQAVLQQQLELAANLARVAAVVGVSLWHVNLALAALTMAVPSVVLMWALHRVLRPETSHTGKAAPPTFVPGLWSAVRQQTPNSLYYCLSSQLPVWLVAWLGQAQQVAEVGALGRLALMFAVLGSVLSALVMPYFARPRSAGELRGAFMLVNGCFAGIAAALVLLALVVPHALLWVLGPQYQHLQAEAVWMVLSASLAAWSSAVYAIGAARGWVTPAWLVIPLGLATLGLAVLSFDVTSVAGAFQVQCASAAAATLLVVLHVAWQLQRHLRALPPGQVG